MIDEMRKVCAGRWGRAGSSGSGEGGRTRRRTGGGLDDGGVASWAEGMLVDGWMVLGVGGLVARRGYLLLAFRTSRYASSARSAEKDSPRSEGFEADVASWKTANFLFMVDRMIDECRDAGALPNRQLSSSADICSSPRTILVGLKLSLYSVSRSFDVAWVETSPTCSFRHRSPV